jgi:hypothetical protein
MVHVGAIAIVFLSALIGSSIGGDACYWTNCGSFNEATCATGDIEKTTWKCGDLWFIGNRQKRFCCDPKRCAFAQCHPIGCTSCSECPSGQRTYPADYGAGPQDCTTTLGGVELKGKKNWCCSP